MLFYFMFLLVLLMKYFLNALCFIFTFNWYEGFYLVYVIPSVKRTYIIIILSYVVFVES